METFDIERNHVLHQFKIRYKRFADKADEIIDRLIKTLVDNTPEDWRFTESPSSRFFIIDEETGAKFMGMSYRSGPECTDIINFIQQNTKNSGKIFNNLKPFVDRYMAEVINPDIPIVHEIRTVYPQKKGDIAEEKHLVEKTRDAVPHIIPLISKKIASRPNAVSGKDGVLRVRQYVNWVSMKPGSKEYYLFHPLKKQGIDKSRWTIYSYDENGNLKRLPDKNTSEKIPRLSDIKTFIFNEAKNQDIKTEQGLRSESYWRVPTYLDRQLIDLDFKERYSGKKSVNSSGEESKDISSSELVELYFLKIIVNRARNKLYGA